MCPQFDTTSLPRVLATTPSPVAPPSLRFPAVACGGRRDLAIWQHLRRSSSPLGPACAHLRRIAGCAQARLENPRSRPRPPPRKPPHSAPPARAFTVNPISTRALAHERLNRMTSHIKIASCSNVACALGRTRSLTVQLRIYNSPAPPPRSEPAGNAAMGEGRGLHLGEFPRCQ
ncbi:hypothetical protein AAFF_G00111020 [Aldrovandia affinis]|uniref:Uncharacterized protein n=1 Tax=Aldrovandia affinis TaxID=143900 RepID=A0AAD7WB08_9TELE|nr:hypothetical protein AAFF_G00111020 [Aldrovandia affinis]